MTTYKSAADMSPLERLVQDVLKPPAEDLLPESGPLQVQVNGGDWLAVTSDVWRAWTGLRRIWGVEHHGPVYPMGSAEDALPYDGARVCPCSRCQEHVRPAARPN